MLYKNLIFKKLWLITLSILSVEYCFGATILIRDEQDFIEYVTHHSTESDLRISFAHTIPPEKRTEILNNSFRTLAEQNLTHQIKKLDLHRNELTTPPVLTGLSSLQVLDLFGNQLTTPPVLTGLTSLQELNLSDNKLTTPPVLTGLSSLQTLLLHHNKLTMPPILTGLSSLKALGLSENQLTTNPVLTGLSSLKTLALSGNPLTTTPVLTGLSSLQTLNLNFNPLTTPLYIPNILRGKLDVFGYDNIMYGEPKEYLLKPFVTEGQLEQISPLINMLKNEDQAKIIATAWLSQQNQHVQDSSTNIIFLAPHIYFTEDGLQGWTRFKQAHPAAPDLYNQPFLMKLPLHSIDALLVALDPEKYDKNGIDLLPLEDIYTKEEFVVNKAEFDRLVQRFEKLYDITLSDTEKASIKTHEQQYSLRELVNVIRQKKTPSPIPTEDNISVEDAKKLIHQNFPSFSSTGMDVLIRTFNPQHGSIKKSRLQSWIEARKKAFAE